MRLQKLILTLIIFFSQTASSQQFSSVNRWIDSISKTINEIKVLQSSDSQLRLNDSSILQKLTNQLNVETATIKKPSLGNATIRKIPSNKAIDFTGGFINYSWNYRSAIDTPFQEKNLSQHFLSVNLNFTIAQSVPIVIIYFDRESNSRYFRDYRDFRVEFNTQEFNRLQAKRLSSYSDQIINQLRNPLAKPSLDYVNKELDKIENWKCQAEIQNRLIEARTVMVNKGSIDTLNQTFDSTTVSSAKNFLNLYEEITKKTESLKLFKDSIQKAYVRTEKEIATLKKILKSNQQGVEKKEALEEVLNKNGIKDERLKKLYNTVSSIKTLSIGKTVPNYSELTLKNINVNGINFEYNRGICFAFSAGAIDYRARDFFYSKVKRKPQFIYAARLGYGTREGTHIFLTSFKGKKQILSSTESPTIDVYGLSFESQLSINKNHRLTGEIAQSASPALLNTNGAQEESSFNVKDEKNRAYSIKLNSYFPKTRSRIEALYKYRGINYQNFSSYYTNAALHQWSVRADQYLFRRTLRLNVSVAKNTYENPYLLTRYNGNTVFKNVTASFKKSKWPGLTVGYMPSSQLSEINGQIYENFYQALNIAINHQYKIGIAQAFSLFSYNRFYNDARDTGFLYYDAKNYFFNQHFQFLSYSTDLNIARTKSRDYALTVLEAGVGAKVWKRSAIGFGVKINQLNNTSLKVGLYGSEKISIPKIGELNAWIEKSYLPGWKGNLVKTEFYNIGFFRIIN